MTDNAKNYFSSIAFQAPFTPLGARHLLIDAYCPWQSGKVERFNQTLQAERTYRQPFTTSQQRAGALEPWLDHYNNFCNNLGTGGRPPVRRIPS